MGNGVRFFCPGGQAYVFDEGTRCFRVWRVATVSGDAL